MTRLTSLFRAVAAAALLACAGTSQATVVVYTSEADFLAALSGTVGTDTFDDLVPGTAYGGPLARSAGSLDYSVGAGPSSATIYGAGSSGDAWLSTNFATDAVTFNGFAAGTYAAGANVFGSDIGGNSIRLTSITVTATDASGTTTETLKRTNTGTFIGFISDSSLDSFSVAAVQGRFRTIWPTVNNFVIAAVPEPETYAMLLSGLAVLGFVAARRRVR